MDYEWLEDMLDLEVQASKNYRERRNPFDAYNNLEFKDRFHLHRQTVEDLINEVSPLLEHTSDRGFNISPDLQVLITLRFLTCSTYQCVCADLFNVHRTTVSRCIHRVVNAIVTLRPRYIKFPDNLAQVKQRFYNYGQMPGVIGCINGTHIPFQRPPGNPEAEVFRCRKGFYSLNVQVVCGPDHKIYDIVARWPGSTYDSRIFANSRLKTRLENEELHRLLLGDAGYPCLR
jgi:hypothetical protein